MKSIGRREFLSGAAKVAGVVGVGAAWPGLAWADPLGLPIGIQLYTVGSDIQADAPAAIRKISAIGYKEVETAGFGSLKTAAEFRKALDDNGLKCPSAHVGFDLANLGKSFDDVNALGCKYATSSVPRMMIMPPIDLTTASEEQRKTWLGSVMSPMTEEDSKRLADAMNKVGDAASKAGLTFASHNHTEQFSPVGNGTAFDYLVDHTDPKNVKFEIDCGWATVAGFKPADLVKKHPDRVKMLHIKDFLPFPKGASTGGPIRPKGSEIGQGVVNYKEIFAGVKGRGIEHIFVEQEGPYARMPAMQAAEVDYKYLHGLPG
ncbi:sugar phosphate isomerase/epimerase family protein [Granulicella sibirica]|uniref:Sugar phosphate isomerase n=1 Tax=Granulicella sibirica TaxID=2479048 RepID=A0A4Q0SWA8_9BACT|nr:sugar phosphate isomerase/epimerase [Granulicella sibirica]RXH55363.1 Sugar phosphate isomerase [Granulicella sibirica]